MKLRHLIFTGFFAASGLSQAAIVVDGDISDWIGTPTGSPDDWTATDSGVKSWIEDQGVSYLDPGFGGQTYDAEAIYVKMESDAIKLAIVTGLAPDSTIQYPAGDIAFDFGFQHDASKPTTEILNRSFEFGLVTLQDATGISAAAGTLYQVDPVNGWNYGLWNGSNSPKGGNAASDFNKAHPTTIKKLTGTNAPTERGNTSSASNPVEFSYGLLGTNSAPLAIGNNGGKHYLIEASIPWALFPDSATLMQQSLLVHWTMACANDFVEVDPPAGAVPTPAPVLLLLAGLLPLLRHRRH